METLETVEVFEKEIETSSVPSAGTEDWTESEWFQTWLQLARGRTEQQMAH